MEKKELEHNITLKLEHIEQIIYDKYVKIEKDMNKVKDRNEIID